MILNTTDTKYEIKAIGKFKNQLKKVVKQGKDISKFREVLIVLANGERLDEKYRDHKLINDNHYKDCRECHIEPDWLLVYKYNENELILFMVGTGSHSEIFNK